MKKIFRLRAKTHSYLKNNNDEDKQTNDTQMCVINRKLKFKDYKRLFRGISN